MIWNDLHRIANCPAAILHTPSREHFCSVQDHTPASMAKTSINFRAVHILRQFWSWLLDLISPAGWPSCLDYDNNFTFWPLMVLHRSFARGSYDTLWYLLPSSFSCSGLGTLTYLLMQSWWTHSVTWITYLAMFYVWNFPVQGLHSLTITKTSEN